MTSPKHQHTVPRFYLEGFTNKNGEIWVYDFVKKTLKPQTPINTGVRTKFYTGTDKEGNPVLIFDDLLSKLEGYAKPIIDKLINQEELTDQEYSIFSYFLSYSIVRVPVWKRKTEAVFIDETKKILEMMYGTIEASEKTMKVFESNSRVKSNVDPKKMHEFYKSGEWELQVSKNYTLGTMVNVGNSLAQPLYNLEWRVLHAVKKGFFLTSDNPLSILSPNELDNDGRPQGGLLEPKVYKLFPLNSKTCLHIGYNQDFSISHDERTPRNIIRVVNSTVIQNSERFIYSHDRGLIEHLLNHTKMVEFRNALDRYRRLSKSA